MQLRFVMPSEVAMIASVEHLAGETAPTARLAVYKNNFDAGESDGRLTGESDFADLRVRAFFPGSGCGVAIDGDKISYAEPGLQGFVGKRVSVLSAPAQMDTFLLVWKEEPVELEKQVIDAIKFVIGGLSNAFT